MIKLIPAPGTYIAEEIKDTTTLKLDTKKTRLLKGKVIAVGDPDITDYGIVIETPVKLGDTAYFLSYEGDYDNTKIDGKTYFTVLRKDHRFIQR